MSSNRVSLTIIGENDKNSKQQVEQVEQVNEQPVNNQVNNQVNEQPVEQPMEQVEQVEQVVTQSIEQTNNQNERMEEVQNDQVNNKQVNEHIPNDQIVNDQVNNDQVPNDQVNNEQLINQQLIPNDQLYNGMQDYNGQVMNQIQNYDQNNQFYNSYINEGINIIDPNAYSPMVYIVDQNKMVYSDNSYPYIYNIDNKYKKNSILPYVYISRNSAVKPEFDIKQNKLKLYNYWINTTNPKKVQNEIIKMFGIENIYITKSLFFRKKNSYTGEKVILINKLPQKPYKFVNRLNRTLSNDRRTIKSVLGDYVISPDCIFIILAEKSIDYICNNYLRYHKEDSIKISTLINSIKAKFTCIDENEIEN